jgi:hypothetical protein
MHHIIDNKNFDTITDNRKTNITLYIYRYEKHMGTMCIHSNQEIKLALQRQQLP